MTNKEKYIDNLRSQYADEPNEFLELCWLLHDYDKAKAYADLLCACTSYAEIAQQVVCRMYVSGDIDETRARSEKFLSLLIPLACLETGGNSHAAVYPPIFTLIVLMPIIGVMISSPTGPHAVTPLSRRFLSLSAKNCYEPCNIW